MYTTLIAIDIVAFGDPSRDTNTQSQLRTMTYKLVTEACAMTQIPWHRCHSEDRGDGLLIIAPPDVNPDDFLDPLAHHLHALLRRYNRHAAPTAQLRLRVAVHHGYVQQDEHGYTGHATTLLFRLLESTAFKRALNHTGCDLGLLVSHTLHTEAIQRGGLTNPNAYQQLRITCKETRTHGWLWLPPSPMPLT